MLYARVASGRQEEDGKPARQRERLTEAATERGYEIVQVITEQASSLNERRRGMQRLLALIGEQTVEVVLIEDPDRLVRFGFSSLEAAFRWMGVRLEVLDPLKRLEPSEELVQDLLTVVTMFAGRLDAQHAKGIGKRIQTTQKRV